MSHTNHFSEPPVPYQGPPTQQTMSEAEWVFLVRMRMRAERNRNHALAATTFVTIFILVVTGWHFRSVEPGEIYRIVSFGIVAAAALIGIARIYLAFVQYIDEAVDGIDEMLREGMSSNDRH